MSSLPSSATPSIKFGTSGPQVAASAAAPQMASARSVPPSARSSTSSAAPRATRPHSLPYGFARSRPGSPAVHSPAGSSAGDPPALRFEGATAGGGSVPGTPRGGVGASAEFHLLNRLLEDSDHSFVYVKLVSAHGLRAADFNNKSDPYACVKVGGHLIYSTTLYNTLDPVWNEESSFALEGRHDFLTVRMWDEDLVGSDTLLGEVRFPLWEYEPDTLHDLRVGLEPAGCGEVRVQFMYCVAVDDAGVLLPEIHDQYEDLAAALVAPDQRVARYLVRLVGRKSETAADRDTDRFLNALLTIYQNHTFQATAELLEWCVRDEVERTEDPSTLFRSNSVATKLLSQYALSVGGDHLRRVLQPLVLNVCQSSKTFEIDPHRLKKDQNLERNRANLTRKCQRLLDGILGSPAPVPRPILEVAAMLKRVVSEKFPGDAAANGALAGFYFLRFLCPALVAPAHFDIVDEAPSTLSARFLLLVTKTLQRLVNRTASCADARNGGAAAAAGTEAAAAAPAPQRVQKEAYMSVMEPFIEKNLGVTAAFLADLTEASSRSAVKPAFENLDQRKFARALLFVHQFLHRRYGDVFDPVAGQPHDPDHPLLRECEMDVPALLAFKTVVIGLGDPAPTPTSSSLRRNKLLADRPSAVEKHERFMRRHSSLHGPHPQTEERAKPRGFIERVKNRVRGKVGGPAGGGGAGGTGGASAEEERDELRQQLHDMFEAYNALLHQQERDIAAEASRNERLQADLLRIEAYAQRLEGVLVANDIPLPDLPPGEASIVREQGQAADDPAGDASAPRPTSARPRPRGLSTVPDAGEDELSRADSVLSGMLTPSSSSDEEDAVAPVRAAAAAGPAPFAHAAVPSSGSKADARSRARTDADRGRHRANSVFMRLQMQNAALRRTAEKFRRRGDKLGVQLRILQRERDAMRRQADNGARHSVASVPGGSGTDLAGSAADDDAADNAQLSASAPGDRSALS